MATLNEALAGLKRRNRNTTTPSVQQGQTRLDPDRVNDLIAKYEAGATQQALAREFGVCRDTVFEILKRHRVQRRSVGLSAVGVAKAVELYASGWSAARVGGELGVDAKLRCDPCASRACQTARRGR